MRHTYRKLKNKGLTPHWYHTDRGQYVVVIVKTGTKWMTVQYLDGLKRRVPLSEKRYMKAFTSKRG